MKYCSPLQVARPLRPPRRAILSSNNGALISYGELASRSRIRLLGIVIGDPAAVQ
jgi:hypothetical protein